MKKAILPVLLALSTCTYMPVFADPNNPDDTCKSQAMIDLLHSRLPNLAINDGLYLNEIEATYLDVSKLVDLGDGYPRVKCEYYFEVIISKGPGLPETEAGYVAKIFMEAIDPNAILSPALYSYEGFWSPR